MKYRAVRRQLEQERRSEIGAFGATSREIGDARRCSDALGSAKSARGVRESVAQSVTVRFAQRSGPVAAPCNRSRVQRRSRLLSLESRVCRYVSWCCSFSCISCICIYICTVLYWCSELSVARIEEPCKVAIGRVIRSTDCS